MVDLFDNLMGLDGFEFVEFASPATGALAPVFDWLGVIAVAKQRSNDVTLEDNTFYDIDFQFFEGVVPNPKGCRLQLIDHLTHNVYRGRVGYWANFYEHLFNFREILYFDIKDTHTGLLSEALTAPNGKIRIPLNEEANQSDGPIEEFLLAYNSDGIQYIALICDNLVEVWDKLKKRGLPFMSAPPDTYYDMLQERLAGHGERVSERKTRGILLDGAIVEDGPHLLLQIFSETVIGPIFFEFIRRKRDRDFGEVNFTALFESIERDQLRRGVISA